MRKLMIIILALVLASSFASAAEVTVIRGKGVNLSSWAKRDYSAACYRQEGQGYICPGMSYATATSRNVRTEARAFDRSTLSKGKPSIAAGPMIISGKPGRSFRFRAEDRTYLDQYKKY